MPQADALNLLFIHKLYDGLPRPSVRSGRSYFDGRGRPSYLSLYGKFGINGLFITAFRRSSFWNALAGNTSRLNKSCNAFATEHTECNALDVPDCSRLFSRWPLCALWQKLFGGCVVHLCI